jgi:CubicO group peptidase (beta-lactamase class C family)
MKKWILGIISVLLLVGAGAAFYYRDIIPLLLNLPKDRNVLFWTQEQRDLAFRNFDKLAPHHKIPAGFQVAALPKGTAIDPKLGLDTYMAANRMAGLIIVQGGKVRYENYGLDFDAKGRWTSFSVAKSITSTLVGAAIKDGAIKSLDDKVTQYIPDLRGSAYDDVTVEQLLTMTSGVRWNEDYSDPNSDVAKFNNHVPAKGMDVTVSYMKNLPREAAAGSKWVYKTGETNLIGVLVSSATGKELSAYASEKIWRTFGMEAEAVWITGSSGHEISGCCFSARLRDFARFGQFILAEGKSDSGLILPKGWIAAATTKQADIGTPGKGYGYQWWTYDDGSVAAQGIFGQGIFIDPKRNLVIASNGNWPSATDAKGADARAAMYQSVQAAIDAETDVVAR